MSRHLPLLLSQPTRLAGLPRRTAVVIAGAIACVLAAAVAAGTALPDGAERQLSAHQIHAGMVEAMRHGEQYYPAAQALRPTQEAEARESPIHLPTLSVVEAALPGALMVAVLWMVGLAAIAMLSGRLFPSISSPTAQLSATVLLLAGTAPLWRQPMSVDPELWAGLLVALSLAVRQPQRWIESVGLGLAAALVCETASPYLLVMATAASLERRPREAAGWLLALLVLLVAVAVHVQATLAMVTGPALGSSNTALMPSASFLQGLGQATALGLLPDPMAALLATLAWIGWASSRSALGIRVAAVVAAQGLLAMAWTPDWPSTARLIAPVLLAGLVFLPDALRDLAASALDSRRITVRRVVR